MLAIVKKEATQGKWPAHSVTSSTVQTLNDYSIYWVCNQPQFSIPSF
ncbi:hypothetical protein AM1_1018 [Acaryochloris marina MBIC11017]|uniref:Uncharacterized protein n=1 Tax=Acaryochloris marina (strain MBIC 11017) TaxID=329726 RepID=B0C0T4_ACAM1|nr:hypothetical protein AM1_1018 [Acaryochloris marina MBIC11017]